MWSYSNDRRLVAPKCRTATYGRTSLRYQLWIVLMEWSWPNLYMPQHQITLRSVLYNGKASNAATFITTCVFWWCYRRPLSCPGVSCIMRRSCLGMVWLIPYLLCVQDIYFTLPGYSSNAIKSIKCFTLSETQDTVPIVYGHIHIKATLTTGVALTLYYHWHTSISSHFVSVNGTYVLTFYCCIYRR